MPLVRGQSLPVRERRAEQTRARHRRRARADVYFSPGPPRRRSVAPPCQWHLVREAAQLGSIVLLERGEAGPLPVLSGTAGGRRWARLRPIHPSIPPRMAGGPPTPARRWVLARTVLLFPAMARAAALLQRDSRVGPSGPGGRPEA